MTEEMKPTPEQQPEQKAEPKPVEKPEQKPEAKTEPKAEPKAEPKKAEQKPEVKKKEVVEKPANCMKCNKRLQRKVCYYRNEGYYCSKRCWKLAVEAAAKKKEDEKAKKEA
ncbi:MAG: hypothetical protein P9L93_03325 [Candidatus Gorgyraea atricola]|nr:hypothetical protein [Candidatus Gorgyraea atricola]